MKTKIEVSDILFTNNLERFDLNFKHKGFILDEETQEIYKIIDKEISMNIGDMVVIEDLYGQVLRKEVNLTLNLITYNLGEDR